MSTYSHPTPRASDRKRAMRPRLRADCMQEPQAINTPLAEIRDVLPSELQQFPGRRLRPQHRATRSVVCPTTSYAKLQSRPSTAPSPSDSITSNSSFSSSSVLDISPVSFSPITTKAGRGTAYPITSQTSLPSHNLVTHTGHIPHPSTSTDCVIGTSTNSKEQKLARILRPIKSSLNLVRKDSSKDKKRLRKASLPSHDSAPNLQPEHPPLPPKPNFLISPRRPRTTSVTTELPPVSRVDAEIGFPGLSKSRTAFASNVSLSRERALPPLPTRPHTSSGSPSPRLRTLSHSNPPRHAPLKRPTTAPATCVTPFDESAIPTRAQLSEAAALFVLDENGMQVPFGNLFLGVRTVVIFIRHFLCPLCQDYMFSISRNVNPAVLKRTGVNLVIISNGSHNMIKSYRQIFRTPFAVYIDPTHRVYKALGMTLRTLDPGPESAKGGYIRHGLVGGITMVVKNAIKAKMPVWGNAGDVEQLGGEFVLGPGLRCTFAHRMRTTRSHTPIQRVLTAAGVDIFARWEQAASICSTSLMTDAEEAKWMEERNRSLAKLKEKKSFRRGDKGYCGLDRNTCEREDVQKDARTVSPSSARTVVADDELGVKILEIGKSVLEGVPLIQDSDGCWRTKDYHAIHPAEITDTMVTDIVSVKSPISLASDSDSYWDYYFEQSSRTEEVFAI